MNYTKKWEEMKKRIDEDAKHAEKYWHFNAFKNATELVFDIGEEVYFSFGGEVYKSKILSINPNGICKLYVTDFGNTTTIYHPIRRVYTNPHYAFVEAAAYKETSEVYEEKPGETLSK